jgi:pimeloyl-ACP methyl ester carboxylesterase
MANVIGDRSRSVEVVTSSVRHGFVEAGRLRLHYLEFEGGGRPLVCLHGVTGHAWMWHDVASCMPSANRIVALDMRGHGDSQWSPTAAYSTEDHASDLSAFANALKLERFDLAGLSWGGLVALCFAARHPEQVRRLALIDVPPAFSQTETDLQPRPASFATDADAIGWQRLANPRAPESMVQTMAHFGMRPGHDGWEWKHDAFFLTRWPFRSDDWWDELSALALPVLVIRGRDSVVLSGEVAQQMVQRLRNGRLIEVPESGHLIPVENPTALADALSRFFSESGASDAQP